MVESKSNAYLNALKNKKRKVDAISEEIKKLESELNESSSDSEVDLVCLSKYDNDRIEPLPDHLLPKGIKQKSFQEKLKHLPNCCRPCGFQGKTLKAFRDHLKTKSHFTVSNAAMKKLKCKQCRIQFNSPDQLKEHTNGKRHAEKVKYLSNRR